MDEEHHQEIEEIMGVMKCPNGFKCYKSGLEALCKARNIGAESFLLCWEKKPERCKFLSTADGHLCECPLRIYIARKLKK